MWLVNLFCFYRHVSYPVYTNSDTLWIHWVYYLVSSIWNRQWILRPLLRICHFLQYLEVPFTLQNVWNNQSQLSQNLIFFPPLVKSFSHLKWDFYFWADNKQCMYFDVLVFICFSRLGKLIFFFLMHKSQSPWPPPPPPLLCFLCLTKFS